VTAGNSVGVRWYELRMTGGGTPSVYQQGTYAPDATYRFMGSMAIDKAGGIGLGYSASSSTIRPEIRFTGRLPGEPLGQMGQGETTIVAGIGAQTLHSRWGDYTSMVVDPVDGCTFWYANQYLAANGVFNWHTRIASFQLPNCAGGGGTTNDFSLSVNPTSGTATAGGATLTTTVSTGVVSGTAETVTFSVAGLPAGATASFSPASVLAGGSSTLALHTTAATPPGTYLIVITGTAASATRTASYAFAVVPSGGAVTNGSFESGLTGWTSTGSTAAVQSPVHSGFSAARIGATTPTTTSTLAQTFTVGTGHTRLTIWYQMACPDTVSFDWFTITLRDNTTGQTTTPLGRTCATMGSFQSVVAPVVAGHGYTLTLTNRDDNYTGDASYTFVDDIATS
jgi:hypothetical protein